MKFSKRSVVSLGILALFAASASAQSSAPTTTSSSSGPTAVRSGFFIEVGLAYGSAGIRCDGCSSDRESGPSGDIHLGGTINPHLRIGVESNGWAKTVNGVDEQFGVLSGVLYVYPSATNNFWVKGGAGYAVAKESDNFDEIKAEGVGISVGLGYDWAVGGGNFVIVPYAGYLRQLSGNVKLDGSDTGVAAHADLLQVGVGFGYKH